MTGKEREVEIRYYCANDKITTSIIDIKEPVTCNYIMSISTPLLCKYPKYKPKKQKVQEIYCFPKQEMISTDNIYIPKKISLFDDYYLHEHEQKSSIIENENFIAENFILPG